MAAGHDGNNYWETLEAISDGEDAGSSNGSDAHSEARSTDEAVAQRMEELALGLKQRDWSLEPDTEVSPCLLVRTLTR